MRTRSKLLCASLGAALLLSMAVTSATARRLSFTNRQFRVVWSQLRLNSSGGFEVRCAVTLEGSFHSATIHKVIGALLGNVTRGTLVGNSCTGGRETINQEALPWHVTYGGFSGTLPNITLIFVNIIGWKWTAEVLGVTCTTQTTAANPGRFREIVGAGGSLSELRADEEARIPLRGSFFCSFAGEFSWEGTGRLTLLGNTTIISVRLI